MLPDLGINGAAITYRHRSRSLAALENLLSAMPG